MFKLYMRVLPCGTIEGDQAALYMRLLVVAALSKYDHGNLQNGGYGGGGGGGQGQLAPSRGGTQPVNSLCLQMQAWCIRCEIANLFHNSYFALLCFVRQSCVSVHDTLKRFAKTA